MVAELRAYPKVEVFAFEVAEGASASAIAAAEAVLRQPLPADLRAFYEEVGALFLQWGLKASTYKVTEPFGWPDYGSPPGSINFLDVTSAISPRWEADSVVNEIDANGEELYFGGALDPKPPFGAALIDNFSTYHHADLVIGPEPVMMVASDHGADMTSSDFMSFATYVDVTVAVYGTNRYDAFGIGWSRKGERIDTWTKTPTLDELIATIEADVER